MNYQQTLDYLYSRLPMFSKLGASAIKADLTNTIELCKRLDDPQSKFISIHVAGTNGKGSVSHMLAAILQNAGYKTGLYTSPHLRDFRERIRVNGEMISEQEVVNFVKDQQTSIEEIEPSFFEVTVAMAFQHFVRASVDIAVIEVGLGGRLDSTNIIKPVLSVITNISYDHVNILGNTLAQIAFEKAGIIKKQIPVVIGERHEETSAVFIKKASECAAELIFAEDEWDAESIQYPSSETEGIHLAIHASHLVDKRTVDLALDLTGSYQLKNVKTVLTAIDQLITLGYIITDLHLRNALKQVKSSTGLMGRWEILNTQPLTICDTGHNEHGIMEVIKNLNNQTYDRLHMVIGMVKDKDITKILSILPKKAIYYFCQPAVERAKEVHDLAQEAAVFGLFGEAYESVNMAYQSAKQTAQNNDMIFIGGSTFVVAEII